MKTEHFVLMDKAGDASDGQSSAGAAPADAATGATHAAIARTPSGSGKDEAASPGAVEPHAGNAAADGAKGYWPDDWQTRVSKGDEKRANVLKRFASPEALADAYVAANNRIRSGELAPMLPKDAKPEELTQWRKDMGIPDKPEGYADALKFDDGVVIGAEDKPAIEAFLKSAHDVNMRPEQVKQAVHWYAKEQERLTEVRAATDEKQRLECLDALNTEWGKDFRRNVNMIHGAVLSRFPDDVREALAAARLPDGRGVFNHPEVLRAFASLALEIDPAGVLTPSTGGDVMQSIDTEIEKIEKWMGANRKSADGKKYWDDPKISGQDGRYQQLLDMRAKARQKAA